MLYAVVFALVNMICSGLINYEAGTLTRKISIFYVSLIWNATALVGYFLASLFVRHNADFFHDLRWGILTGITIAMASWLQLRATLHLPFARALPVIAVSAAATPPIYRLIGGHSPSPFVIAAIFSGGYALLLLTKESTQNRPERNFAVTMELVASGVGWGLAAITLSRATGHAPTATWGAAHAIGLIFYSTLFLWKRPQLQQKMRAASHAITLGVLVIGGDVSFLLGVAGKREKYVTMVTLIGNLNLAIVVLLAHFLIHERLTKRRMGGLGLVLLTLGLVTLGSR